jgi:hypothetical protein
MSSRRRARATRRPKRRRQVSRRRQVRRRHRRAGQGRRPTRRAYTKVFAEPDRGGRRTTASSPSPRRCRPAPGSTCSARRSRPHLRCRHRRAARRDLRRRPRDRRATSRSARSIRPSCSAPTTRSCTTWRSRACRCASPSTAPAGRRRWRDPCRLLRHRLSRRLPGIVVMAAADEAELMHMVATARDRRPPDRLPLSARRGRRRRRCRRGSRWRSARAASCARAQGRHPVLRHAPGGMPEGRPDARASPSRWTRVAQDPVQLRLSKVTDCRADIDQPAERGRGCRCHVEPPDPGANTLRG